MGGMDIPAALYIIFAAAGALVCSALTEDKYLAAYLGYCGGSGHNAVCRYGAESTMTGRRPGRTTGI